MDIGLASTMGFTEGKCPGCAICSWERCARRVGPGEPLCIPFWKGRRAVWDTVPHVCRSGEETVPQVFLQPRGEPRRRPSGSCPVREVQGSSHGDQAGPSPAWSHDPKK